MKSFCSIEESNNVFDFDNISQTISIIKEDKPLVPPGIFLIAVIWSS